MRITTLLLLLVASPAFSQVLYSPFLRTEGSAYVYSDGDLAPYMSRIPVLTQYDWSRPWESKEKILARTVANGFTSAQEWNVRYIIAEDCNDNGPDSDDDKVFGTTTDGIGLDDIGNICTGRNCAVSGKEGTIFILKDEDPGGPQSPCYYNWIGSLDAGYSNIHIAGQSYFTTKLVHGETPDLNTTFPSVAIQNSTSWTNVCDAVSSSTYSGSLAAGTTQITANTNPTTAGFSVGDNIWIQGTDQDNQRVAIGTHITNISGNNITIWDPIPTPYSTVTAGGTLQECNVARKNVFWSDMHMYAGYGSRGACSADNGTGCSSQLGAIFMYIMQTNKLMFNDVVMGPVYRSPMEGARTTNVIWKGGGIGEYLVSSRRGNRTGMISENQFSSTYRFYDFWLDTGSGRIIGNDGPNGNHYLGFMHKANPAARGTYVNGINTGHSSPSTLTVTDTGDYCSSISTTDTWFPSQGQWPERDIFHHGCDNGGNADPWVVESSNLACHVMNECHASGLTAIGRYHTLHRIRSVQPYSASGGLITQFADAEWAYANVLFSKFRTRTVSANPRSTWLGVNNIFGTITDGGTFGTDINTDTGSGANDACATSNDPPSVVLRQSAPPCFWCSEFGNATNNYGWNGSWDMGSCDASNNVQIPAEIKWRIFNGEALTCTPPPTCVDY